MEKTGMNKLNQDPPNERPKIIFRVVLAVALIAALLGGLLLLEQQSTKPAPEGSVDVTTTPDIGKSIGGESPRISADIDAALRQAPDVAQAALASMSAPVEPEPSPLMPAAQALPEETAAPVEAVKSPTKAPEASVPNAHVGKELRRDKLVIDSPKPKKESSVVVASPAPAAAPVEKGVFVQVGVFSSLSNTEDLLRKLKSAGIPSSLEARVQIGPFASKQEAQQVQTKLQALGLGNGMLVPVKKP